MAITNPILRSDMPSTFPKFGTRRATDMTWGVCMAIYGPAGSGKSTLAAGAADSPDNSPLLIVDAEGGSRAVAHRADIEVLDVKSWKDIDDFTEAAKRTKDFPWKTVVFDNMSEYLSLLTNKVVGSGEDSPSQPQWGKITLEFLSFVRTWRDLSRRGINVILIAWEDEEKDEVGRVKHQLSFTPKIRSTFPGMIDIIGYLTVVDKSIVGERLLDFAPSSRTASKFRRSQDEGAMQIPLKIQYGIGKVPMADILTVLKGGGTWPKDKYSTTQPAR